MLILQGTIKPPHHGFRACAVLARDNITRIRPSRKAPTLLKELARFPFHSLLHSFLFGRGLLGGVFADVFGGQAGFFTTLPSCRTITGSQDE